jgi:molybdopterin-guanine dinucleotide biosynthesis protein B
MKAIQVVGYKNTGKSSLILEIAKRIKQEGNTVCALKHATHLSLPAKDKNILKYSEKYMITSDEAAVLYIPSFLHFLQTIAFLHCDYLIIEGFKEQEFIPRIVCWKDENEKKELASDMNIGYCGPGEWKSAARIDEFIKAIKARAFLLPGLDCGKCECKTCKEMAKQILAGNKSLMDCLSINVDIKVTINGNPIALSPFIVELMKQTFGGFIKSLKGVVPGNAIIELQIEP